MRAIPLVLLIVGAAVALGAHVACTITGRRAKKRYREIAGPEPDSESVEGGLWSEVRSMVGVWGCLTVGLEFLRGLGVVVALFGALYLILGR